MAIKIFKPLDDLVVLTNGEDIGINFWNIGCQRNDDIISKWLYDNVPHLEGKNWLRQYFENRQASYPYYMMRDDLPEYSEIYFFTIDYMHEIQMHERTPLNPPGLGIIKY